MGWAAYACERLRRGETVQLRPRGSSTTGRVSEGNVDGACAFRA